MGFEAAPFKLPLDYVDIIGGLDSPGWAYFKKLFKEGFECARKHSDSLISKHTYTLALLRVSGRPADILCSYCRAHAEE